jgi:hypothetical protein
MGGLPTTWGVFNCLDSRFRGNDGCFMAFVMNYGRIDNFGLAATDTSLRLPRKRPVSLVCILMQVYTGRISIGGNDDVVCASV